MLREILLDFGDLKSLTTYETLVQENHAKHLRPAARGPKLTGGFYMTNFRKAKQGFAASRVTEDKFPCILWRLYDTCSAPFRTRIWIVTISSILLEMAVQTHGSEAKNWLLGLKGVLSTPLEIEFKREIPPDLDTNIQVNVRIISDSPTTQDWFHAVVIEDGTFWVGNSLSSKPQPSSDWPAFKEFRWVVGSDSTNFWFVDAVTNLSFAAKGNILSPPQQFSLGLYGVVREVLSLGIIGIDLLSMKWTGDEFTAKDEQGRNVSGQIESYTQSGSETLRYGRIANSSRVAELIFDRSINEKRMPRIIRCKTINNGIEQLRVTYEILRLDKAGANVAFVHTPPILSHANAGKTLMYSKNGIAHLTAARGELQKVKVSDPSGRYWGYEKSVGYVVRILLLLLLVLPISYLWRKRSISSRSENDK